jgi:hypothetical protein
MTTIDHYRQGGSIAKGSIEAAPDSLEQFGVGSEGGSDGVDLDWSSETLLDELVCFFGHEPGGVLLEDRAEGAKGLPLRRFDWTGCCGRDGPSCGLCGQTQRSVQLADVGI